MNQIGDAATQAREQVRSTTTGQFGTQQHAESGLVSAPTTRPCRLCGVELVERKDPTRMQQEQGTWFDHPAISGPPSLIGHTRAALVPRETASR